MVCRAARSVAYAGAMVGVQGRTANGLSTVAVTLYHVSADNGRRSETSIAACLVPVQDFGGGGAQAKGRAVFHTALRNGKSGKLGIFVAVISSQDGEI